MNTRRKSRAVKAASASQQDAESSQGDSPLMSDSFTLPPDIDVEALSELLPGESFESPTVETITNVYRLLISQALQVDATSRDLEELRADFEKKEVEVDQAYQDKENDKKELENSVENAVSELKAVKVERDELATAKAALQTQLSTLSTSSSASTSELDALKLRVEDTEREKRDLVGVVSRLKEDCAQRDDEIKTLRTNLKQSRHDYQALESQLRELRSSETSSKFKLDSLSQQLALAKDESERAVAELNSKAEEFSKYRRTKHAELAQLQSSHDALSQTLSTTESTLKALQSSHTSQSQQLTQALTRVQDLSGQLAEQEATYSSEATGLRRLVGMMEERESHAKEIVDNIEREWAAVGDKAERRELKLKEEIDRESRRADDAEKRIEELERVLERLDRGDFPLPPQSSISTAFRSPGSLPSTPARSVLGTPDFMTQGMMGLSPTVAIASRAQKSGKTFTEVYAEYVRLQEEYAKKTAECDHMDRTLQAVLAQIEERAPILSQQRSEYERLQAEASQLASQLAAAISERDSQSTQSRDTSQKLQKTLRENQLLESQLNDLGAQVQTLLRDLTRLRDPTIPTDDELEADPTTAPAAGDDIQEVITNNLVRFRSIEALQEQNQKLLKITRDLADKMESEEKEYKETLQLEQAEAVMEAHAAIQKMQEDLDNHKKSSELTIQAYMKERDALKSMLARAEQRASGMAAVSGLNGQGRGMDTDSELVKELEDVQKQFEEYRTETGVDSIKLREELMLAQKEAGHLGAALAKANAKAEYLNDRHRMSQEQSVMASHEIDNLTKRNQQLYDQYTRIDIECNRITEDLITSNGRLEQLRNECANLRAEKNIWESVQHRLVEENKSLSVERSHLSDLMSNVQKMHNDLERSGENDRRRLESQIQMLETQTADLRSQLTQERDSVRHITLQKEIESKDLQTRIDRSVEELSKTRESLVEAETSRKHLEERVQELTRHLQGNTEKLAVYERRGSGTVNRSADDSLSREQQLEAEVAELRATLKIAEVDLANAKSHVQQFQEISLANEEALSSLNATYDEFRSSTEAQIAKHESDYGALQDNLHSVQIELTQLREKHEGSYQEFEKQRKTWTEDKKLLEDTIADMTTSERSVESDRASRENEVRQLEDRAKAAEQKYTREVVSHAESIKAVEELKANLASAKSSARDAMAEAETATAKLTMSESSWKQQKEALDRELADLNNRCKDLVSQNGLLHNHLESVSSQAAKIRDATNSSAAPADADGDSDGSEKMSELRSVVAWLRKEKDIVELQLELSKQEAARLKTQVDHLTQSLNQTRTALSEERERAEEAAASQAEHDVLMGKINELTVFRESNATLRADCDSKNKRIIELDAKLQQLNAALAPAQQELLVAKAELEARDSQLSRLQEDNRKWQERNSQLMSKYDRIDPAELQGLRDELERLKSQNAQVEVEAVDGYKKQIETLETKLREAREFAAQNQQRVRQQMSGFNKDKAELNATINDLRTQLQKLTSERDSLKTQPTPTPADSPDVKALNDQIETLRNEKAALEISLSEAKTQVATGTPDQSALVASLQHERDALLAEKATWAIQSSSDAPSGATGPEGKAEWESEKSKIMSERDAAQNQSKEISAQLAKMKESLQNAYRQQQIFKQRISSLETEQKGAAAKQQQAIDTAVAKAQNGVNVTAPPTSIPNEELVKKHAEELKALEERLNATHKAEVNAAVTAAKQAAVASASAAGSEENQKAAIEAALAAAKAEWAKTQDEALEQAVERGRQEQSIKARLKDSQLMKSQNRVKELEAQLLQHQAGTKPSVTPAVPAAQVAAPAVQPKPPTRGGAVARGRGVTRTLTGALGGRGGAPAATAVAVTPTAAGGVSIMGAAKRPRDEGETPESPQAENSLAKRLKPAESKPVPIRRPNVPKP